MSGKARWTERGYTPEEIEALDRIEAARAELRAAGATFRDVSSAVPLSSFKPYEAFEGCVHTHGAAAGGPRLMLGEREGGGGTGKVDVLTAFAQVEQWSEDAVARRIPLERFLGSFGRGVSELATTGDETWT